MPIRRTFNIYSDLDWKRVAWIVIPYSAVILVAVSIPFLIHIDSVAIFFGLDPAQISDTIEIDVRFAMVLLGVLAIAFMMSRVMRAIVSMSITGLRSRMQLTLEGAEIGVWECHIPSNALVIDDACAAMLGHDRREIGSHVDDYEMLVHPDEREGVVANFLNHIADDTEMLESVHRMRCKSGQYRWFMCRGRVIERTKNGEPVHLVGTMIDIHDRVENEIALAELRDELELRVEERTRELEHANAAKSEFLANMSHDLRTPLTVINGIAQLWEMDESITDKQREHAKTVQRSGDHLLNMINDVLQMSQLEAGRTTLNDEFFEIEEQLEFIEQLFRSKADAEEIDFVVCRENELPEFLLGDAGKLRQILINFLGNAFKFTSEGKIALSVACVKIEGSSCLFRFTITDTGVGMTAEDLATAFEPFTRSETTRKKVEGAGLGLAICKRFVELMDGEVTAESAPGEGTTITFTVRLETSDLGVQSEVFGLTSHIKSES